MCGEVKGSYVAELKINQGHYNPALFRLNGNKVGQQTSQHFQNDVLKEITKISQLDTF
jgi:hypothetical protein